MRPIGIGEVIRRIIGKTVIATVKSQIVQCAGPLQLCAGQRSGCEAAVHAMTQAFDQDESEAILLVDAANAFNSINRKVLLHNIQYLCPVLAIYTINCYQSPSRLFVQGGKEISSAEGTTQGDSIAMPIYAIGITPLLREIKDPDSKVTLAAFADDLAGAGKLQQLLTWWNNIVEYGPLLGYNPQADKSWLVVKEHLLEEARVIFATSIVNITVEGHEYLGGFVGSTDGQMEYARKKVDNWVNLVRQLAAYAAFIAGFCGRLNYFIRTTPNLSTILHELDQVITNELIPAITDGLVLSSEERVLLSLPVKLGGLGIPIFAESCKTEYQNSLLVCSQQAAAIVTQNSADNTQLPPVENYRERIAREKGEMQKAKLEQLRAHMSKKQVRANDIAQMKGSSSWLTALPIKKEGYVLSKRQFFDALALRYRWRMKRLPSNCACGKQFTVDHAISYLKGGFIHRRHDELRDIVANLLDEVAYDVRVEPPLTPLTGEGFPSGSNIADDARLDIAARGFWERCEMAFFDIRVFNPYAKTHLNQNLNAAFTRNEREK